MDFNFCRGDRRNGGLAKWVTQPNSVGVRQCLGLLITTCIESDKTWANQLATGGSGSRVWALISDLHCLVKMGLYIRVTTAVVAATMWPNLLG